MSMDARTSFQYSLLGSCGTVAGLVLGLRAAGLATPVVGVQVVNEIVCNRGVTLRLVNPKPSILQLFELTQLHQLFEIARR